MSYKTTMTIIEIGVWLAVFLLLAFIITLVAPSFT